MRLFLIFLVSFAISLSTSYFAYKLYKIDIPPKLKPEKFIDKSVSSSKTSKLFDNITKNKKKGPPNQAARLDGPAEAGALGLSINCVF